METSITATCACKSFTLTTSFPTSYLPLPRALCLCSSCRRLSGSIGGNSYIQLLPPPFTSLFSPTDFPCLTAYETSEKLVRYWCGTCGAQIFVFRKADGTWHLATGLWDRTEGVVGWTGCKYVGDTGDGGISVWLRGVVNNDGEKRKLKRWVVADRGPGADLIPTDKFLHPSRVEKGTKEEGEERLSASCHCKGVQFYVTRPNASSIKAWSPYPDLMIPHHTGASAENLTNDPWFLRASKTKYLAGTCTCTSCRHSLGFEIQTWAFVPKCNIFSLDGKELDYERLGTLKRYAGGREGVKREFCGVCGANVFWHCAERPTVVDVSVGVFESDGEAGVRCERWLDWWTGRVSFAELGVSGGLIESLESGLRSWGKEERGQVEGANKLALKEEDQSV